MRTGEVYIDAVTVPSGRRPLNAETVDRLVESIGKIGLQQPISVWSPDSETAVLVAGHHRLEACRRLDMHKVPAVFVDMDELDRELWEIVENLHRLDLTKEQRDQQIRRYAELLRLRAEREPVDGDKVTHSAPVSDKGGRGNKGIASRVAAETGLSKSTVNRVLNPKPAAPVAASKPVPPPSAPLNDFEAINKQVQRIMSAWNAAGPEARDIARGMIDGPIMDATTVMREFVDRNTGEVFDNSEAGMPDRPFGGTA